MLLVYSSKVLFETRHSGAPFPLQIAGTLCNPHRPGMEAAREEVKLLKQGSVTPLVAPPVSLMPAFPAWLTSPPIRI